jgi:hypothetical protein
MKKLISITLVFVLMLIFIGCSTMKTAEQRRETPDLRSSVGNQPFVGGSGLDQRGLMAPDISH